MLWNACETSNLLLPSLTSICFYLCSVKNTTYVPKKLNRLLCCGSRFTDIPDYLLKASVFDDFCKLTTCFQFHLF